MTISATATSRPPDTLPDHLLARAAAAGAATAYYDRHRGVWRRHSWRELADRTALLASALAQREIGRGDGIALIGNRPALVAAMVAAQSLGAVPLILAPELPGEAIADALLRRRVRAVFVDGAREVALIAAMRERLPDLELVVFDQDRGGLQPRQEAWLLPLAALTTSRTAAPVMPISSSSQDAAYVAIADLQSTPHAVSLSHGVAIAHARKLAILSNAQPHDRMLAPAPLSWQGALISQQIHALLVGFPLIYPGAGETALRDLRDAAPTLLVGPPRLFGRLRTEIIARTAGSRTRRLFAADGTAPGVLSRLVWIDPLRDQVGLRRVRAAVSFGGAPEPEVARFFATLGIAVRDLEHPSEATAATAHEVGTRTTERGLSIAHQAA